MSANNGEIVNPAPQARSGCWSVFWRWILPFILLGMAFLAGLCVLGMIAALNFSPTVNDIYSEMRTKTVREGDSQHRVAIIRLNGEIEGSGSHLAGDGMLHTLAQKLRAAANDSSVKTVLLEVNSPGGGLTQSDILYHEVRLLQEKGKKVVAAVQTVAASGGYYIIAAADRIFVSPTSLVGSFGVIMEHFEISELLSKIGVKCEPLKSTGSKDIGSMFRPMKPDEKEFFTSLLGIYHQRFVDIIAAGRKLDRAAVARLANGKVYPAQEAQKLGLVDAVGYFDEALQYACGLTGAQGTPEVIMYEDCLNFQEVLDMLTSRGFGRAFFTRKSPVMNLRAEP